MSLHMWRKYKQKSKKRVRLDSSHREESRKVPLIPAERTKAYRERKRVRALDQPSASATAFALNPDDETVAVTPMECSRSESDIKMVDLPEVSNVQSRQDFQTRWSHSNRYLDKAFLKNDFGHACYVCDGLWFRKGFKSPTIAHLGVLPTEFVDPNLAEFSVCNTCRRSLNSKKIPRLAKNNGFRYPPKPRGLPALDPISEKLFSPRLPFMQIRRLQHEGTILLCRYFNMDITQNKSFVNPMKPKFNLDCISSASATLSNTCIGLTFTRKISVQTLLYVPYFSYYRPVLNRLMLSSEQ